MVTVAEVNRSALRSIGADFSITHGKFAFAQVTGNLFNTTGAAAAGTTVSGIAGYRRKSAHVPRQRRRFAGDQRDANPKFRTHAGRAEPDDAQCSAGQLSCRGRIPRAANHAPPARPCRHQRRLYSLRRRFAIHAVYHRPRPHPALRRQRRSALAAPRPTRSTAPRFRRNSTTARFKRPSKCAKARRWPWPV